MSADLQQYGFDSILVMKMTNQLETFGSLSKTLFFEHKNIASIVDYFVDNYAEQLRGLFPDTPVTLASAAQEQTKTERVVKTTAVLLESLLLAFLFLIFAATRPCCKLLRRCHHR